MSMLKELENLLRDITEQQPARARPRPSQRPAQQQTLEYLDAEIVEAEPIHEGIAEHVSQHLDTDDITSRASHLGTAARQADDKLESHIHDKFDRDLSKIDDHLPEEGQPSGGKPAASEIAEMLRNPKSIRQAVILSEILNRPHA